MESNEIKRQFADGVGANGGGNRRLSGSGSSRTEKIG
jgi:hypothetical protein